MTTNSFNWSDTKINDLFNTLDCPEFDTLTAYHNNKVSKKIAKQIEKHILDCKLCASVIEGLPEIDNLEHVDSLVQKANTKIDSIVESNTVSDSKDFKDSNTIFSTFKLIFTRMERPLYIGYATAMLVLCITLFSITQKQPQYYDIASLNQQEQEMLMLINNQNRGDYEENEFSQGAVLLLDAEYRKVGVLLSFDNQKINDDISHLKKAYNLSNEPFYQNKYAYFIGKAYLMNSDLERAKEWLKVVVQSDKSAAYQDAAIDLLNDVQLIK